MARPMNRLLFFLLLLATCLGCTHPSAAFSAPDPRQERIISFVSRIDVHADSSMTVTETIKVHAEGREIKRGIYRDFPTRYTDRYGSKYVVEFELVNVSRDGMPDGYHTEELNNGKRVYLGRKDHHLSPGDYVYSITYRTNRQLGFFQDHDELYWNVTGNGWVFPIEAVSATVVLPGEASFRVTGAEGYTGPAGATGTDYRVLRDASGNVTFITTRVLGRGEGLTLVVTWPKGYVNEPSFSAKVAFLLKDNRGTLIGLGGVLFLFFFYLILWVRFGRDPEKGTVIPVFEAPSRLSPASMRYIMQMGYDEKVLAAAVINMAVKGFLAIEEASGRYTLKKLKESMVDLTAEESLVAKRLFETGIMSVELRSQARSSAIVRAIAEFKASLKNTFDKVYFVTNRKYFITGLAISALVMLATTTLGADSFPGVPIFLSVWLTFWSLGVVMLLTRVAALWREVFSGGGVLRLGAAIFLSLFATPFVAGEIFALGVLAMSTSFWTIGIMAMIVCINLVFYRLLKAPTRMGRQVMDQMEGFRMYLSAAEKDRLNILNPPQRTPALFEKCLPYALALDVEQQWAEQFADVFMQVGGQGQGYTPLWYTGSSWHSFSTGALSGFTSSFTAAIAASSSSPGSSSGSGGGGSSGGGGGGGGGGGW